MAAMFGSYVGEVYRRHHGGEWGIARMGDDEAVAHRTAGGVLCWPWIRATKRITEGPEDDVLHYYQSLLELGSKKPTSTRSK